MGSKLCIRTGYHNPSSGQNSCMKHSSSRGGSIGKICECRQLQEMDGPGQNQQPELGSNQLLLQRHCMQPKLLCAAPQSAVSQTLWW